MSKKAKLIRDIQQLQQLNGTVFMLKSRHMTLEKGFELLREYTTGLDDRYNSAFKRLQQKLDTLTNDGSDKVVDENSLTGWLTSKTKEDLCRTFGEVNLAEVSPFQDLKDLLIYILINFKHIPESLKTEVTDHLSEWSAMAFDGTTRHTSSFNENWLVTYNHLLRVHTKVKEAVAGNRI